MAEILSSAAVQSALARLGSRGVDVQPVADAVSACQAFAQDEMRTAGLVELDGDQRSSLIALMRSAELGDGDVLDQDAVGELIRERLGSARTGAEVALVVRRVCAAADLALVLEVGRLDDQLDPFGGIPIRLVDLSEDPWDRDDLVLVPLRRRTLDEVARRFGWRRSEVDTCPIQAAFRAVQEGLAAPRFHVTGISSACRGGSIKISGSGFGSSGSVSFPRGDGGTFLEPAERWTATEVETTVPEAAFAGMVRLVVVDHTFTACGGARFEVHRLGEPDGAEADTGPPALWNLAVNGDPDAWWAVIGETLTITWQASSSPSTRVSVQVWWKHPDTGKREEWLAETVTGGSGAATVVVPYARSVGLVHVVVSAINDCSSTSRSMVLRCQPQVTGRIVGVEVTQGTQIFWIDPPNQRNNSLKLVAGKTTALRVFAEVSTRPLDFDWGHGPGVTPPLAVSVLWSSKGGEWTYPAVERVGIDAHPAPDRARLRDSFAVIIPSTRVGPQAHARVQLGSPIGPEMPQLHFDQHDLELSFAPSKRLRVAVVPIHLQRDDVLAPIAQVAYQLALFPLADDAISVTYPVTSYSTVCHLDDQDSWDDLRDDLEDAAEDWPDDWDVLIGLVPSDAELPAGHKFGTLSGIARNRVAVAVGANRATVAHEVAHLFDIGHSRCTGKEEGVDDDLPVGAFYENPFDPYTCTLYNTPMPDLMGYCTPVKGMQRYDGDRPTSDEDNRVSPQLWNKLWDKLP